MCITSRWDQKELAPEHSDAGEVFSSKATRSRKLPNSEVVTSIVCSEGHAASVVFYYPIGYSPEARNLVMRTLSFGDTTASANSPRSLVGDWNSEDGVLTLN